jgi:alpha-tubulin suppressor-like RCC1 family protein
VASVTVVPQSLSLFAGEEQELHAVTRDQDGRTLVGRSVSWTTSAPTAATVSASGLVTGVGAGSATITATSEGKSGSAAVSVAAVVSFASVAAGGAHTCALTASGAAWCWGRGESGQLGVAPPTTTCPFDGGPLPCTGIPLEVGGGHTFVRLVGGGAHTCGLTSDGSTFCWGDNAYGQLGDNSSTDRSSPTPIASALRFVSIDAGASHTCGLTSDGLLYCWGRNDRGQLGDGTTSMRFVPTPVTGNLIFSVVAAGGFDIGHTCALTISGVAWCWGANDQGQLGGGIADAGAIPHPVPALVAGGHAFTFLTAASAKHTCALIGSGAAYCWGENAFGALGNGGTENRTSPVAVSGGMAFVAVTAGGYLGHTCGLSASGAVHCWGENSVGQVGDGSTLDRLGPSPVAGGLTFTSIDAGFRHTCGRASTGTLYCWGSNGARQLGINSDAFSAASPTRVVGQPR